MTQSIEIFRTGRHTAMGGETLAFGEADLAAMVAAYDPALHEALIVVGHPNTDDPAYGWIASLAVAGDRLQAMPRQVNPDFAELVRQGSFKRVSASFYAPDSHSNPKPGAYYLRHVGFLGAQPPAVKGLKPVAFADGEAGIVEFSEGWTMGVMARLLRGLRDWMIGTQGQEAADKALPAYDIENIAAQAVLDQQRDMVPAFSETPKPQETSRVTEAEHAAATRAAAAEVELVRLRQQVASFAEQQAQTRIAEDAAFLERLEREGRLLPANRPLAVGLLNRLDGGDAVSFAEGRAAETPREALRALLAAQPVAVSFGEFAGADGAPALSDTANPSDIARASVAFQEQQRAKGIIVSNIEAVMAVTKGADR